MRRLALCVIRNPLAEVATSTLVTLTMICISGCTAPRPNVRAATAVTPRPSGKERPKIIDYGDPCENAYSIDFAPPRAWPAGAYDASVTTDGTVTTCSVVLPVTDPETGPVIPCSSPGTNLWIEAKEGGSAHRRDPPGSLFAVGAGTPWRSMRVADPAEQGFNRITGNLVDLEDKWPKNATVRLRRDGHPVVDVVVQLRYESWGGCSTGHARVAVNFDH